MNDQQTPGAGKPGNEAALEQELRSVQQAIADLNVGEQRLEIQFTQITEHISRYEHEAIVARASDREAVAREARERSSRLHSHLFSLQQQIDALKRQREPLLLRQEQLQSQFVALPRPSGTAAPGLVGKPPTRRKRRAPLLVVIFASLAIVVLVLSLVVGRALRSPVRVGATSTTSPSPQPTQLFPTPTEAPTPPPLSFQPNGSAPTSADCTRFVGAACYSPEQIQQAFSLTSLYKQGYDGHGQTIVILGAGHTTSLQDSLHQFDLAWGLPDPPSFQILQPNGDPAPYACPQNQDDLLFENTLDVEWSHAIAPGANIILLIWKNGVEGSTPQENCGLYNIDGGVAYATDNQLGQIITISYGGSELGDVSETSADRNRDFDLYRAADVVFKNAAAQHITVLAAAGDTGVTNPNGASGKNAFWPNPNVSWPASDPYVLAVGGTSLQIADASGSYGSESVWDDSIGATGGGLSAVFPEPDYQQKLPNQDQLGGKRAIPDVSFPAKVSYSLYSSADLGAMGKVNPQRWNHWGIVGGTSVAAPCWAGLIALANQVQGSAFGFLQPLLYALHGHGLHDITSGDNSFGGVQGYPAQPGYDLATGWGTPIADQLIARLIAQANASQTGCHQGIVTCQ